MNYLPFISWGMYGGATAAQRASFFVSWGMMDSIAAPSYAGAGMMMMLHVGR